MNIHFLAGVMLCLSGIYFLLKMGGVKETDKKFGCFFFGVLAIIYGSSSAVICLVAMGWLG